MDTLKGRLYALFCISAQSEGRKCGDDVSSSVKMGSNVGPNSPRLFCLVIRVDNSAHEITLILQFDIIRYVHIAIKRAHRILEQIFPSRL